MACSRYGLNLVFLIAALFSALILTMNVFEYVNVFGQTGVLFHPSILRLIILVSYGTVMSAVSFIVSVNPRWDKRLLRGLNLAFLIVLTVWVLIEITVARAYSWVTNRDLIGVAGVFILLTILAARSLLETTLLHRRSQGI